MKKNSHDLLLVSAAAVGSSVMVITLMCFAGVFASTVAVFSLLCALIAWSKIGSFRRTRMACKQAATRPPTSVFRKRSARVIRSGTKAAEKISA
jgi:hypothetical protein